jgi:multiple antibiotic resistance protein
MTRIMGLILLSMSIEMIAGGIKEIMPILKAAF